MPSPLCLVADGAGPFNPTFPNGLNINPGDTVSIVLQSSGGATNWYLQVGLVLGNPPVVVAGTGLDEQTPSPPTLTGVNGAGLVTGGPTATVTFTFPNAPGRTLLFSSTVTGTFGSITTTFALFAPTAAGYRVGATGMSREGSNAYGWTPITNASVRAIGTTVSSVTGSSPIVSSGGLTPNLTFAPPGQTAGDLVYFNGTSWVRVPRGSAGQFLATSGTGPTYTPTWQTIVSGIPLENNGTPIAGNPHTTFNFVGIVATDNGGGLATITGLIPGGDLTGNNATQTVSYIQGLSTAPGVTAEGPAIPVILPFSPLGQCDAACSDGTNVWVGDGDPPNTTLGVTQVYKTDGTNLLGLYKLPADATAVQAIISDGSHVFVLVDPQTTTNCLYVLTLTGTIVGVGQFPSAQAGGELAIQGGYCWCQDQTNGLTGFSIATMLGNGPGTPTPPGKTLPATSGGSVNSITTDGTNLYATGGTTVWQIAPAGPSITTSVTPPFGQVNGVFYASIGPGPRIYCGVYTGPSTNEVLVLTTALATVTSFTPDFAGGTAGFVQVTAQDGTYLYLSAGNGVTLVDPSTFATVRTDFSTNFLTGALPACNVGSTVYAVVQGLNGLSGIQAWTQTGPGLIFIGNLGLQYAPGVPDMPVAYDYNLVPTWSWRVHNPYDGTTSAGSFVAYNWNTSTEHFGLGPGWLDFLTPVSTPAAPTLGQRFFVDSADGKAKLIDPSSVVTELTQFIAGADLTGTVTSQTVSYIQGLPTTAGSTAAYADLMQVVYDPPWTEPSGITCTSSSFSSTVLWVSDGSAANLYKVVYSIGNFTETTYPVGDTVGPLTNDGTHVYGTGSANAVNIVLAATGAVVGIGSGGPSFGIALDGAGFVWVINSSGLAGYNIAALLAAYPTPVAPAKTLSLASAQAITSDGSSFLYVTNGSSVYKVNPATPAFVGSPYTPGPFVNQLLYTGTTSGGAAVWAATPTTVYRIVPSTMTLASGGAIAVTGANTSGLGTMAYNGTYLFISANSTNSFSGVELVNPATNTWFAEYAPNAFPEFFGRSFGLVNASGTVWVTQYPLGTANAGIQAYGNFGPSQSFIGPLGLGYEPYANGGTIMFANSGIQFTQGQLWGIMTTDTDGATITFNLDASQEHQVTLGGNRTLVFNNVRAGGLYFIRLIQDGTGGRTVTWPVQVYWGSGSAPNLHSAAGAFDQFVFTSDGTNLYEVNPATSTIGGYVLSATPPTNGQILMYNSSAGQWQPTTRAPQRIYGVSQTTSTTQSSAQTLSMFDFNPSSYPSPAQTITAVVIVQVASVSDTITVQLWNFTTATLVTTFTSSSITAVQLSTVLGTLPSNDDIYYWACFRTGGLSSDAVTVHNAYLLVS